MSQKLVDGLIQVCLVVEDFDATVKDLATLLGIGPWKCWTYEPPALLNIHFQGQEAGWTLKLGVAWLGPIQLEVIQPLEGHSLYREYLDAHGEGVQHLMLEAELGYGATITALEAAGYPAVQGAGINPPMQIGQLSIPPLPDFLAQSFATQFVYHDTETALGTVLELSKMPPGIPFRLGVQLGKPDFWVPEGSTDVEATLLDELISGIDRVGILTRNLGQTRARWLELGVGPWKAREAGGAQLAAAPIGAAAVELAQPDGAGIYQDLLEAHGEGVGYLRVQTGGMSTEQAAARFEALGCPILAETEEGVWIDARDRAKTIFVI